MFEISRPPLSIALVSQYRTIYHIISYTHCPPLLHTLILKSSGAPLLIDRVSIVVETLTYQPLCV